MNFEQYLAQPEAPFRPFTYPENTPQELIPLLEDSYNRERQAWEESQRYKRAEKREILSKLQGNMDRLLPTLYGELMKNSRTGDESKVLESMLAQFTDVHPEAGRAFDVFTQAAASKMTQMKAENEKLKGMFKDMNQVEQDLQEQNKQNKTRIEELMKKVVALEEQKKALQTPHMYNPSGNNKPYNVVQPQQQQQYEQQQQQQQYIIPNSYTASTVVGAAKICNEKLQHDELKLTDSQIAMMAKVADSVSRKWGHSNPDAMTFRDVHGSYLGQAARLNWKDPRTGTLLVDPKVRDVWAKVA